MPAPLDQPIVCPVLIGRTPQYESLTLLLAQADAGRGQAALIAGDAGVGKSRLVAEAKVHAAQRGFHVLQGQCFATDRTLPYAPLLDLLRIYLAGRSNDEIRDELGPAADDLVILLPDLTPILNVGEAAAIFGPEPLKRRLFEPLFQLLTTMPAPLLIVVEDLHWSDDASLEFLLYLARRAASQRVMLLLTYRSDEIHPALAALLADLNRERRSTDLTLDRLTRDETGAFMPRSLACGRRCAPIFSKR